LSKQNSSFEPMNGEHVKIYDKIDSIRSSLGNKIDAIKIETSEIKTDVALIKNSLKYFPCEANSKNIKDIELKMYMAIGGLSLILISKQLGLW